MNGKKLLTLDAELVIITCYVITSYVLWIYNSSTLFINLRRTCAAKGYGSRSVCVSACLSVCRRSFAHYR